MISANQPFQSTLPVRGATPRLRRMLSIGTISIHAPRAGSDALRRPSRAWLHHFNPRSPCGERHCRGTIESDFLKFQSTLPVRGATCQAPPFLAKSKFQSTLPVRGATQRRQDRHAGEQFQSTLPVRGATFQRVFHDFHGAVISIHAPRAGSDAQTTIDIYTHLNISIHAPRAGSDCQSKAWLKRKSEFQSTLPVRGATSMGRIDSARPAVAFQSTLPVRGATISIRSMNLAHG